MHPIPVKSRWYHIGIDFSISPSGDNGSRYIFTMSDDFTKWIDAVPTVEKSASTVAMVLFRVLCIRYIVLMLYCLIDLHEDVVAKSNYI